MIKKILTFKLKIAILVHFLQLVSACAITSQTGIDITLKDNIESSQVFNNDVTYTDIRKIHPTQLSNTEDLIFKLESNDDNYDLPLKANKYKLFEIFGNDQVPLYYKLYSYIDINESTHDLTVALPVVAIINKNYSLSRISLPNNFSISQTPIWGNRESLYLYIKLDPKINTDEKYILLLISDEIVNESKLRIFAKHMFGGVTINTTEGNAINASPDGEFVLQQVSGFLSKPFDRAIKF